MQQITTITDQANQLMTLVLDNGETALFRIYYLPRQQNWFFDIIYKEIAINSIKVVLTPNALRQFKKQIPFGIAFVTEGSVEPFNIFDFSTQRIKMFVLNSEEVQRIEQEVYNI